MGDVIKSGQHGSGQRKALPVSIPLVGAAQHVVEFVAVSLQFAEHGLAAGRLAVSRERCLALTEVHGLAAGICRVIFSHLDGQAAHVVPALRIDADAVSQAGVDEADLRGVAPGASQISGRAGLVGGDDAVAEHIAVAGGNV